jgi:hypothetical protein
VSWSTPIIILLSKVTVDHEFYLPFNIALLNLPLASQHSGHRSLFHTRSPHFIEARWFCFKHLLAALEPSANALHSCSLRLTSNISVLFFVTILRAIVYT